jgi:hypothetical protein
MQAGQTGKVKPLCSRDFLKKLPASIPAGQLSEGKGAA